MSLILERRKESKDTEKQKDRKISTRSLTYFFIFLNIFLSPILFPHLFCQTTLFSLEYLLFYGRACVPPITNCPPDELIAHDQPALYGGHPAKRRRPVDRRSKKRIRLASKRLVLREPSPIYFARPGTLCPWFSTTLGSSRRVLLGTRAPEDRRRWGRLFLLRIDAIRAMEGGSAVGRGQVGKLGIDRKFLIPAPRTLIRRQACARKLGEQRKNMAIWHAAQNPSRWKPFRAAGLRAKRRRGPPFSTLRFGAAARPTIRREPRRTGGRFRKISDGCNAAGHRDRRWGRSPDSRVAFSKPPKVWQTLLPNEESAGPFCHATLGTFRPQSGTFSVRFRADFQWIGLRMQHPQFIPEWWRNVTPNLIGPNGARPGAAAEPENSVSERRRRERWKSLPRREEAPESWRGAERSLFIGSP